MTISHNLYWDDGIPDDSTGVQGTDSIEGDPGFTASSLPIAGETTNCPFYLNSASSAALNAGYYPVDPFDLLGQPRDNPPELGAFEKN